MKEGVKLLKQDWISKLQTPTMDETIHEIQEREKRATNVMIFNLPASESANDLSSVKEVVKTVTKEDLYISKVLRVGKKNATGSRALKVVFSKPEDAKKMIRSRKEVLKGKNIFISPDSLAQVKGRSQ